MDNRQKELSLYRIREAEDSLIVSENCLNSGFYKDSINRSYYAAFYAIKSVLALGLIDFKRHKDVIAYFNKEYVAAGVFSRDIGKRLSALKQLREKSDYDDFFLASKEQAKAQHETAALIIKEIQNYLEMTE